MMVCTNTIKNHMENQCTSGSAFACVFCLDPSPSQTNMLRDQPLAKSHCKNRIIRKVNPLDQLLRLGLSHSLPEMTDLAIELEATENSEDANNFLPGSSHTKSKGNGIDAVQTSMVSPDIELGVNHNDIWLLFNEAQQNILYLNKQRLMAMEKLNKIQKEKELLLSRIKQLESEKMSGTLDGTTTVPKEKTKPKGDKPVIFGELLLRIDSMVLSGAISHGEASDLRSMVMEDKAMLADAFHDLHKNDGELLVCLRRFYDQSRRTGLHIVQICTELEPVASVGSLATYVTGLSRALQRKGNTVEVILPKYAILNLEQVHGFRKAEAEFHSYFSGQWHPNRIWTGIVHGIAVTFIEPIHLAAFFSREGIYGYSDDLERFTYFSRAALDYIVKSKKKPDIFHIHGWQTSVIGPLFWDFFVNQGLETTRLLLTCHGFDSQCVERPEKLALCGLDPPQLHRSDRLQDNSGNHLVNLLKGGVVYSNKVAIVSSLHSKDAVIESMSYGLETTLAIHREKVLVIPYGFDDTKWDPSKDNFLPVNYSSEDPKGKATCRTALRQRLRFVDQTSAAMVGCIYTEVSEIDVENLKAVVCLALGKGAQFIFLGSSTTPEVEAALESLRKELKDQNVRFINKYNEALSHLLKAIKYGTIPVAVNPNESRLVRHAEGQEFGSTKSSRILSMFANVSLSQALDDMKYDGIGWSKKIKDAMSEDLSWDSECCDMYMDAYMSMKNL
ncbi:glycogen synthase isoform X2 [Amborella trichopoda]|uniref:glycogen synthase isoform X2 n=1 Tax=Amborella trichopoda TaxID=13333 RepID=UPI0009BDC0FB|nr:glycogen synthase isoform X2 [Amborella trichopoda]|eukprot:XP_020528018.1 glycogen synthase isoform X2 [Amborella trichopoda]